MFFPRLLFFTSCLRMSFFHLSQKNSCFYFSTDKGYFLLFPRQYVVFISHPITAALYFPTDNGCLFIFPRTTTVFIFFLELLLFLYFSPSNGYFYFYLNKFSSCISTLTTEYETLYKNNVKLYIYVHSMQNY